MPRRFVKRVSEIANGWKSLAVQFVGIRPQDQESIVQFCFSRQLEQLRNQSLVQHCDDYLLDVLGF